MHPGPLRALPALARDLEPRLHGVRPRRGWRPDSASVQERRYRHGPRAHGQCRPGRRLELPDRPVRADHRAPGGVHRPRPRDGRERAVQLPGRRRPFAGDDLPAGRGRHAVERGRRIRPAPDHAPRGAPRPAAGHPAALPARDVLRRRRHHGRGLPDSRRGTRRGSSMASRPRRRSSPARSRRARRAWRSSSAPATRSAGPMRSACTTRSASPST